MTSATGILRAPHRAPRYRITPGIAVPSAVLLFIILCLLSPVVIETPPAVGGNVVDANLPLFSPGHLLGTDPNGNDIWARLLQGGRTSLTIALSVNLIGLIVGGLLGAAAGWYGGVIDSIAARTLDTSIAFPSLVLVLAVAAALGPGATNTIWALSFFSVPSFARIARAATLRLREEPFMTAARLCGAPTWRILGTHIGPNIFPQLAAFGLLGMGAVINIEGAVSFLGLGVPLPQPSWGNMISQGQFMLSATPLLVLFPSVTLFVTVLSFNALSEALRTRWSAR